jgi:hypothetical protein
VVLGFAAVLAWPTQSWARLKWPGCGGDSGLTPRLGSAWDQGNRSPRLSFWVRFRLERGLG